MDISGLRRYLPTQATESAKEKAEKMLYGAHLKGPLKEAALEQLTTVPEPWLDRLADEGVAYVALGYGEDLSKTDLITSYTPDKLVKDVMKARPFIEQSKKEVDKEIEEVLAQQEDPVSRAITERERPRLFREKLGEKLNEANIGFDVEQVSGEKTLRYIEEEHNIESDFADEFMEPRQTEQGLFRELLLDLNGPEMLKNAGTPGGRYALADDAVLDPADDVLIVPYGIYGGKRLSEVSKASYSAINGMDMDQHLGAHYWPNRMIVVDDDVVNLPSVKTSYHSVLLHETGHAIDHLAEDYPELDHRKTVDALYAKDMERYKAGEKPFLTPRALDNTEEYFAEAVEAYLTQPVDSALVGYKAENNNQALKERNPELYAHVEKVLEFNPPKEKAE